MKSGERHKFFSHPYEKAIGLLAEVSGKMLSRSERELKAVELASFLLEETESEKTKSERRREKRLSKMLQDPKGRTFLTLMTDEAFRSSSAVRTADQIAFLLCKFGIPSFLDETDRIKFILFSLAGKHFPHPFVHEIKKNIRREMSNVLLPEDPAKEKNYLEACKKENVRININHLGEAILGEEEAQRRLNIYLKDLENPQIEYVSIKISTIFSQINPIGWNYSLEKLSERLRMLYRAAKTHFFTRKDGDAVQKFVNLDMEEYKDLHLTVELFQKVLSEPEFYNLEAGIVLQSYIPDSFDIQKKITEWALLRVKSGGGPIKIRLVKGANLAMEKVESSIKGWQEPTFSHKVESDAHFKKMLEYACEKAHAKAVHIGVGSHNLLDLAYALVLRSEKKLEKEVEIEMLKGMAEPMRRAVQKVSKDILLYCPKAKAEDFQNALAYLVRRLDENTGPENFLKDMFEISPDSAKWNVQKERFRDSVQLIDKVSSQPKRTQNRLDTSEKKETIEFRNEEDTDFSLEKNRQWALSILNGWEKKAFSPIPLVIGGKEIHAEYKNGIDPSRPFKTLYSYSIAEKTHINDAFQTAKNQEKQWGELSSKDRFALLAKTADLFRSNRSNLIGAMIADTGKTIWEADPEVSEAIDFIEYYKKNWEELLQFSDLKFSPKGTLLVTPPWNFPVSIPTGSIAGALTAGNCVLFKPAPEAVLVGWTLINLFWQAGIPKEVLQFVNCDEEKTGNFLLQHPKLDGVILTGSTETALKFMRLNPKMELNAETGGKNALIITALSDRDLAIRDLIQSAFSHSGQKCSACSLAILEREVYEDSHFLQQLKDATQSLSVASAWEAHTKIGPLIRPPEGVLKQGLTHLEAKESWLLEPKCVSENPHLWSCGIKVGVTKESLSYQKELFGPVLSVMCVDSLEEAVELANGTPYGLTSGLHSLDEREKEYWKNHIVAGNLYINRSITGAIVRRQPFGGCKASSFGFEAKAGGPNYVLSLSHVRGVGLPQEKSSLPSSLIPFFTDLKIEESTTLKKSCESYACWANQLKKATDVSSIVGQDNFFFHVPRERAYLRVIEKNSLALLQVAAACIICQTPLEISSSEPFLFFKNIPGITWTLEEEETFIERMKKGRIRCIGRPSDKLFEKAAEVGATLQHSPVLANGRIELLHYLREVSLSADYHRYGYLGLRT